ncbi:hypothetical protein [Nocardioides sp.]|uniref:hypothetical protein n=1 Tax=Nocardioides sp. TaxID=35761 RepID=UPI003D0EC950
MRADLAGDELERRGLPRDVGTPAGAQAELFGVVEPDVRERPDKERRAERELVVEPGHELRGGIPSSELARTHVVPEGQQMLFPAAPLAADVAAAQALRTSPNPIADRGRSREDEPAVSVGDARRTAEVSARLRTERAARTRTWQAQRTSSTTEAELDRAYRDQAEREAPALDRSLRAAEHAGPSLGRR